jgi:hypothetical protein
MLRSHAFNDEAQASGGWLTKIILPERPPQLYREVCQRVLVPSAVPMVSGGLWLMTHSA